LPATEAKTVSSDEKKHPQTEPIGLRVLFEWPCSMLIKSSCLLLPDPLREGKERAQKETIHADAVACEGRGEGGRGGKAEALRAKTAVSRVYERTQADGEGCRGEQQAGKQLREGYGRVLIQPKIATEEKGALNDHEGKRGNRQQDGRYDTKEGNTCFHWKFLPMMRSASSDVMKSQSKTPSGPSVSGRLSRNQK
jgi:hypothetical protein